MTPPDLPFRRSSRCESSTCTEVATTADAAHMRDSKEAGGPVLSFAADQWRAFIDGVRDGEFDGAG